MTAPTTRRRTRGRGVPAWLETVWQDVRYGCRMLARNPGFTAVAVLSLAIGIGANSAVFSFADGLLLRPLPVPRPGSLLRVGTPDEAATLLSSYRDFVDLSGRSSSFDGLAAFDNATVVFRATPNDLPAPASGLLVSGNFFDVMGVAPETGRAFRPDEDQTPGRDAVAVLGYRFWSERLGADPEVVGRTIRLGGTLVTVIGVAPEAFTGVNQWVAADFFVPLMMGQTLKGETDGRLLEARDDRRLQLLGRLKPGTSIAQARAEASVIAADLARAYPATNRDVTILVRTELQSRVAQAPELLVLVGMLTLLAAGVLLVACGNVAGLLTSRAPARAQEIALRLAIGAARGRLSRQLVTESLVIAIAGGIAGLGIAYAGVALFRTIQIPADVPVQLSFALDSRALLASLAVSVVSAVVFGLLPAMKSSRADLMTVIKAPDVASGRRLWGRPLLVAAQVAVTVVVLAVAVFVSRGFQTRVAAGPGYRTDHLLLMRLDPTMVGHQSAQSQQFFTRAADAARLLPGVMSAALTSKVPMDGRGAVAIVPEGVVLPAGTASATVGSVSVDAHYFDTLDIPILGGRAFTASDTAESRRVVIVNEQMARHYWPGVSPIGRRFRLNDGSGPLVEIVGVARNAKYALLIEAPLDFAYFPYTQQPSPRMTLVTETAGDPSALAAPLRQMVSGIDASQPITYIRSMEEFYRTRAVGVLVVTTTLIASLGIMGLGLAIVGLYGLVAYAANRRTREIAIRLAVGARRGQVLRAVLQQGVVSVAGGLVVGVLLGVAAARALGAQYPGGASSNPSTYLVVFPAIAAAVMTVTLLAAYVPARRASRLDPVRALRYD